MRLTHVGKVCHKLVRFALAGVVALLLFPCSTSYAGSANYYVSPYGSDANSGTSTAAALKTIQKAVDLAQPGDTIHLAAGVYLQDVVSRRNGAAAAPITIAGPAQAVVKGGGNARVIEINHDYIVLRGFTVDGLWGNPASKSGYRDKLLFALGKEARAGVSGLRVLGMTFRNGGGECIRLRYFAQRNEIANTTIENCGVHDFVFNDGGKNGEGIYIGTAPEQLRDGKNPTTDPDQSNFNWIHDNVINTQGNECVDIKEAATGNRIERNQCTGNKDPESAGFNSRGNGNIFVYNESYGNVGAGIRLGGDISSEGVDNEVCHNSIHDNNAGGIKFQRAPQADVCGNSMSNNSGGNAVGSYASRYKPTASCTTTYVSNYAYLPAIGFDW